jgi:hypothetical protein
VAKKPQAQGTDSRGYPKENEVAEDKTLKCMDCGAEFTFTAGEQEFFASKGFSNEPKRCPTCRQAKKQQRSGSDQYYEYDQRSRNY